MSAEIVVSAFAFGVAVGAVGFVAGFTLVRRLMMPRSVFRGSTIPTHPRPAAPQPPRPGR